MVFWSNLKLKLKNVFTRSDFDREAVKLTGNQTIRGNKTFDNDVSINSILSLTDKPIRGVKYPVRDGEAANKKYVDDAIANIPSVDLSNYYTKQQTNEKFVDLTTNQTIRGNKTFQGVTSIQNGLSMNDTTISAVRYPEREGEAANKKYVDDGLRNKADNVNVYNKSQVYTKSECDNRYYRRGNIPTPTGANDAVNKSYVDNKINSASIGVKSVTFTGVNVTSAQLIGYAYDNSANIGSTTLQNKNIIGFKIDSNYYIPRNYFYTSSGFGIAWIGSSQGGRRNITFYYL